MTFLVGPFDNPRHGLVSSWRDDRHVFITPFAKYREVIQQCGVLSPSPWPLIYTIMRCRGQNPKLVVNPSARLNPSLPGSDQEIKVKPPNTKGGVPKRFIEG